MECWKGDGPESAQTLDSGMIREDSRQPVHRRSVGPTIRVRGRDCLLADIQAQIEMLWRERTYLRLVRAELDDVEAKC
jgi:hypothetical protein